MSKLSLILVVVFLLALGAGVLGDRLASRVPSAAPTGVDAALDRTYLTEQLQLTEPQREQMKQIWQATSETMRDSVGRGQILEQEHEDALVKMLSPEQKKDYEKLNDVYKAKFAALNVQRDAVFADAVDKTKKILTDTQRAKYEEILTKRIGRVPGFNSAHGGPAFLNQSDPTTAP